MVVVVVLVVRRGGLGVTAATSAGRGGVTLLLCLDLSRPLRVEETGSRYAEGRGAEVVVVVVVVVVGGMVTTVVTAGEKV